MFYNLPNIRKDFVVEDDLVVEFGSSSSVELSHRI